MKKPLLTASVLLALAIFCSAQPADKAFGNARFLKEAGLSDEQIRKVAAVQAEADKEKATAQVELNMYKAKLMKMLLDVNVDLKEVEKLLRESSEWKIKAQMVDIKRHLEIRKVVGDDAWRKLAREARKLQERRLDRERERRAEPKR